VSQGDVLFKGSTVCGGRTHFFDLSVLNLEYYGSSAWEVACVSALPMGPVSMIVLDNNGAACTPRLDVTNASASSAFSVKPPALAAFAANIERHVSSGMPQCVSIRWQQTVSVAMPPLRAVDGPTAKPAPAPAPSHPAEPVMSVGHRFLPLAPSTNGPRRGTLSKPRTKLSRRMAATLAFFADRDKSASSHTKAAKAAAVASRAQIAPRSRSCGQTATSNRGAPEKLTASELLAGLARSDQEVEASNDDSAEDLSEALDLWLSEENGNGDDGDAFDLATCLATELWSGAAPTSITLTKFRATSTAAARAAQPLPMLQPASSTF